MNKSKKGMPNRVYTDSIDQLNDDDYIADDCGLPDDYRDPGLDRLSDEYRDPDADNLSELADEFRSEDSSGVLDNPNDRNRLQDRTDGKKYRRHKGYQLLCLASLIVVSIFLVLLCLPKSPAPADAVYGFELPEGLLFGMVENEALPCLSLNGLTPRTAENGDSLYFPELNVRILGETASLFAMRFTPAGHALTTAPIVREDFPAEFLPEQDGWLDTLVFSLDFNASQKVYQELTRLNGEPVSYTVDSFPADEAFTLEDELFAGLLGESERSGNILIFNGTNSVYDITPLSVRENTLRYLYGIEDRYERRIPSESGISPYVGAQTDGFKAPKNRILSKACLITRMDGTSYLIYQDVTAGYAHYYQKQYEAEQLKKDRESLKTIDFSDLLPGLGKEPVPAFGLTLPGGLTFGMSEKQAKKALSIKKRDILLEASDKSSLPGASINTVTLSADAYPVEYGGLTGYIESLSFIRYSPRAFGGYFPEDSYYVSDRYFLTDIVCRFPADTRALEKALKQAYAGEASQDLSSEREGMSSEKEGIRFLSDMDVYHLPYPLIRAALEQDMQLTADLMNQITLLDQTADDYLSYSPLAEFSISESEDGRNLVSFHSLLADRAAYYFSLYYR